LIDRADIVPTQSNFRITQKYSTPLTLSSQLPVTIEYDPSNGASDTASLYLHSAGGGLDVRIPLRGITTTLHTARIKLQNASNTANETLTASKSTTFTLLNEDDIPDSLALTDIDCDLSLNSNLLTLTDVKAGAHITYVSSSQQAGTTTVKLKRSDNSALSANSVLATLTFSGALSDTIRTDVSLTKVHFNPAQNDYERCVLAPIIDPNNIQVTLDAACTRDLLTGMMAGQGILSGIRAHPSVLTGSNPLLLDLDAVRTTTVSVVLLNLLGEERNRIDLQVQGGHSSVSIPLTDDVNGLFFVEIIAEGTRSTQRILITR
jgi:hypothetical protein